VQLYKRYDKVIRLYLLIYKFPTLRCSLRVQVVVFQLKAS